MFLADQGRDAVIIRRIILFQKFPLIGPPSSIGEVFLGPFYYYLVSPFLWVFHSNPVGLAIGVGLISVGATALIYYLVSKIVSRGVAFIFSLIITFSALFVDIGRFSWNPNPLPYFAFITLSLFFLSLHGKRKMLYSILFGILFGLSFQLHHLAALLIVPVVLYFIMFLFKKRDFSVIRTSFISGIGFVLTLSPFVIFELRHNFLNIHNLTSLFTKQNVVSSGPLTNRFIDVTSAAIQFALHISVPTYVACIIAFAVVVLTIHILFKKKENPFITFQLITFISLLFVLSRVNAQAIPHYFHTVYMSFYFLLSYILFTLMKTKFKFISVIGILFFIVVQAQSYYFIFGAPSRQYEVPERVGKEIATAANGKRINLTTYPTDFTSRDCYQYYVELYGGSVVDGASNEVTNTLFVLCDKKPCRIINSDSWNIQMFGKAKIDTMWKKDGIYIYKLIHQ